MTMTASGTAPGIRLGDRVLTAAKRFFVGTHRTATPEETLHRVRPHLAACGITRLADITGLDRIGIPTVIAQRPNSPTLSNSAGKGFSLAAATVSAAMEGIEIFHAEALALPHVECPWSALPADERIPADTLALMCNGPFRGDQPEAWVWGWDLLNQKRVAAPFASVGMLHPPMKSSHARAMFATGTNGLASGNHLLEAIAAALYEVIERDAVACWKAASAANGWPMPRVDLATIESPVVRDLLARLRAAGIEPLLFDVTSEAAVPVFSSIVYDREIRHGGMHRGYGAHLDPAVAMARALTEAVQARVVVAAGSRDDIFRRELLHIQLADSTQQIAGLESIPPTVDARRHVNRATRTFEEDVALLLAALRAIDTRQAIVFDLTRPDMDIPVVRVLTPGLEGYGFENYRPGPRTRAFTARLAEQVEAERRRNGNGRVGTP